MISILLRRCRRKATILYLFLAIVLMTVTWNFRKKIKKKRETLQVAVLISQRGHSNIPTYISLNYLYNKTEDLRIQTIKRTGVFASVKAAKPGQVNVHMWFDLCGTDLRSLLYFPNFPNVPSSRKMLPSLNIRNLDENYGKRVFGFVVAPRSGSYSFRLKASGSAELWVSSNNKPHNCRKILQLRNTPNCKSYFVTANEIITLKKSDSYYFEILHKHGGNPKQDFIDLGWKIDGKSDFEQISSEHLHGFQDDLQIESDVVNPDSFPAANLRIHRKNLSYITNPDLLRRKEIYRLPFFPENLTRDLFRMCTYKPSYLIKHKLSRYGSKWENIYSSIFPSDHSNLTQSDGFVTFGNDVLEENEALWIVNMVKKQFYKKGLRNYKLQNIINIESKHGRYLVELEFLDVNTKKPLRFSEYLYLPEGSDKLCYPEGFKWNKTSMVHFLVTSGRNQARWVYHFINNMDKIYQETKDVNFNVIINDFLSPHVDIKQALERSSLPHYMLFTNPGKFQKSLGLQQAADAIADPNGIIVILDLHLDIPSYFVDDVRKHTVLGLQAYSPILARMECGTNAVVNMGSYWEFHGYGMVGIYKKDWDKFGGMNVEEFKNKWGGEDIEMVDRILMAGYEIDRKKIVGLVHYAHSKRGMWNH